MNTSEATTEAIAFIKAQAAEHDFICELNESDLVSALEMYENGFSPEDLLNRFEFTLCTRQAFNRVINR